MAVSALDLLIHGVVHDGMIQVAEDKRPPTASFNKFRVRLDSAMRGFATAGQFDWLSMDIRDQHSRATFQKSEKIADGIRLIYNDNLWERVAKRMAMSEDDVKKLLDLIVNRRNQIVHEFDADPSSPGARWPVKRAVVKKNVSFLARLGRAVVAAIK